MLRVTSGLVLEDSALKLKLKQRAIPVLALALITACVLSSSGCTTLSHSSALPSQPAGQSGQHILIQTTLPGAPVGSSYRAVLSVSGGLAPYHFAISEGKLPPGLVLDSLTGSISGIPSQAGTFAFTVLVLGEPTGASGVRAYSMKVSACSSCVAMQISPLDPAVAAGGTVQFTAVVTNTSNTAVQWSASAGSVSANGLFTAPVNSSAKSVKITASSAADTDMQASTTATITSSTFTITTSSVPFAVQATPYSAALTASGGQPPYQWSISSGSLPAGLQLGASTGALSGTATQSGTFTFSVRGTDAASHTAQQSLSLLVSTSTGSCGPPAYGCSRTDTKIVQVPSTPPSVGNLSGANTIVTDPDFGNRIVRITDANTNPETAFKNRTYVTASSGSADDNLWNLDSTLLLVQDSGTNAYPFTFNPSTLQASRMYVANYPATNGLQLTVAGN